ncbi:MAG: DUF58 domain-containing protein [Bacteroidetes bacterium]|nr:DUF58 domain-containing protein [Bacteroidota bacterium]
MKAIFLQQRLFFLLFLIGAGYVISFFFPFFVWIAHGLFLLIAILVVLDILLLYGQKKGVIAQRILPEKLSNGDENWIEITIQNNYFFSIHVDIIDEIPFQFQIRDFLIKRTIKPNENSQLQYKLEPKERGEYNFGSLNIFAKSPLGLVSKKHIFQKNQTLKSYPSFIHLRKYELMALQNEFLLGGLKKIRKIGQTMEFEKIKEYVQGDDIRTINWKATSKQNKLMVNQYQEEKSQKIYLLIDKGRTMQMPFLGMSLLDYSINASMALSHIILKKGDRAGVMSFAKKMENTIVADNKAGQLKKISEILYNLQTDFFESDFNRLYQDLKFGINQRSLVMLFTNFETLDNLKRQLKYMRGISKNHLLVVVFFKNSELQNLMIAPAKNLEDTYDKIIAEKFDFEKKLIIQELRKYGILSLYTKPENLSIEVINKYLEIKSRGMI